MAADATRRGRTVLLWGTVMVVVLGACTPQVEVPRGLGDPSAVGQGEGVCALLMAEEVEVAVNRPLSSGSQSRIGGEGDTAGEADVEPTPAPTPAPTPEGEANGADSEAAPAAQAAGAEGPNPILRGMEMCALGAPRAGAAWGLLTESAETRYRRYAQWHGDYLESVRVAGHEAVWDPSLRTLVVLAGDLAFGLTLTADEPVLAEGEDETAYLQEWAIELAARALGRL